MSTTDVDSKKEETKALWHSMKGGLLGGCTFIALVLILIAAALIVASGCWQAIIC